MVKINSINQQQYSLLGKVISEDLFEAPTNWPGKVDKVRTIDIKAPLEYSEINQY